jgi:hypothetical protein
VLISDDVGVFGDFLVHIRLFFLLSIMKPSSLAIDDADVCDFLVHSVHFD